MKCEYCFHHCDLQENQIGFCQSRKNMNGKNISLNYGKFSSIALDPIEKKPLARFSPGSLILSVGSYGCNLRCSFCQNYEISMKVSNSYYEYSVEELVDLAERYKPQGNIGIAFTYNEPLINWEYICECGKLLHERNMVCVVVSNGCFSKSIYESINPYVDAMNIDLKGFDEDFYHWVSGDLNSVLQGIESYKGHLEVTTLIIPGMNDSESEMEEEAKWLANVRSDIVLHITRYFPRYRCKVPMTPISTIYKLENIAKKYLKYVYVGNC